VTPTRLERGSCTEQACGRFAFVAPDTSNERSTGFSPRCDVNVHSEIALCPGTPVAFTDPV